MTGTPTKMFELPMRPRRVLSELFICDVIIGDITIVRAIAITAVVFLVVDRGVRRHAVVRRAIVLVQNRHATSTRRTIVHSFREAFAHGAHIFCFIKVREQPEE